MIRRRLCDLGACTLLLTVAACSSGGSRTAAPATTIAAIVVTPTTAAIPTTVHNAAGHSPCPDVLPAAPTSRGVGRPDMTLVPIAAVRVDVCTFAGSVSPRTRHGDVALEGRDADTFENAANGLQGVDPLSGPRCEPGPAASVLVVVSDGIALEQLLVSVAGCGGVSNGFLSAPATPTWTAMLRRTTGLANLCARRVGPSASCVAADS